MSMIQVGRRRIAVQENVIDRAIQYVAPVWAQRRMAARMHMALAGGYAGASRSKRSLTSWLTGGGDADADLLNDLPTLRERSRDLVRNGPLAAGTIGNVTTNVVGSGLKLQARIDRKYLRITDEAADVWEENTEREWQLWSESQDCDIARTLNFGAMQELVFRQTLENGDVFINLPRVIRKGSPCSLRLQVIEADRVCNKDSARDSETLSGGIERDQYGAPKNYHILKQHPGNSYGGAKEWDVVPAFGARMGLRNVIHLYRVLRPGQSRGVPYLAPVIESLKQLERYTEAELMAAVVSGMFTVFVESEKGDGNFGVFSPASEAGGSTTDEDYKLGNGAIVGLAPGEKVNTANPGRPNQAFDPFVRAILQQIGVALEIPFEVLVRYFSSSYSASRAALLEAWRFFKNRRAWLAQNFNQVVYENWLTEEIILGRISAPGFFADPVYRMAYCGSLWIGGAPGQIDPLKEVDAAEKRLALCLSTHDQETTELTGGDFDKNLPRIIKERGDLKRNGLLDAMFQSGNAGSNSKIYPSDKDGDEQ